MKAGRGGRIEDVKLHGGKPLKDSTLRKNA